MCIIQYKRRFITLIKWSKVKVIKLVHTYWFCNTWFAFKYLPLWKYTKLSWKLLNKHCYKIVFKTRYLNINFRSIILLFLQYIVCTYNVVVKMKNNTNIIFSINLYKIFIYFLSFSLPLHIKNYCYYYQTREMHLRKSYFLADYFFFTETQKKSFHFSCYKLFSHSKWSEV